MPRKPPRAPPAAVESSQEAVAWFRDRLLMTDDEFHALEGATHDTAFTIAGVNQLDLVEEVWRAVDDAVARGETLDDFQERVSDRLASAWGSEQPWRVETIFRTQAQSAYAAGRYQQMTDPAVQRARPFWRYSSITDQRTTILCNAADDTVLPADHPWWQGHYPPCHFNCRAHAVTLSEEEAQEIGITSDPTSEPAMDGFGAAPVVVAQDYEPIPGEYPPELFAEYEGTGTDG